MGNLRLRVAHLSLQYGDTPRQHTHDISKLFERAVDFRYGWITGTEAGPNTNNTNTELRRFSESADYKLYLPSDSKSGHAKYTDSWIAVRKDLIKSGWKSNYQMVIPGSAELYDHAGSKKKTPVWANRGVVSVSFRSIPELGDISIASGHYLKDGSVPGPKSVINGVDHFAWNRKLDEAFGAYMQKAGAGPALAFAGIDRNASDRRSNIKIPHAKSLADELKKWQNTGLGDIDWILSHQRDGRVKGVNFRVLNDRAFFLHTDHHLVEGVFEIEPPKAK